ncbi:hypothetical protein [Streptomyces sp. NPDC051569]|uniref:hypothetical protein n=1 Tax=Streptomyces sp. NPDC051569 TaxID=3365661 RepID=UPI0037A4F423
MRKIVAFIDEQPCGLAAVRRALPLVPDGAMLLVALITPRVPLRTALSWSQGLCLPDPRDESVTGAFKEVAALLAPTALPWDFSEYFRPGAGAGAPALAVSVRHGGGLVHGLGRAAGRVERFAYACHPDSPRLVVSCDHGGGPTVPREVASVFEA